MLSKIIKKFEKIFRIALEFSNYSRYESVNLELKNRYFPIGILKDDEDDIEIHFLHELNEKDARINWERRLKRIQWNNIFVKFSDYWDEDFSPFLKEFESLKFTYKICFTSKAYPGFSSAFFIPGPMQEDATKRFLISLKYFDITGWLNKIHGSDIRAYRIKIESE